jgi:hypothetical protein
VGLDFLNLFQSWPFQVTFPLCRGELEANLGGDFHYSSDKNINQTLTRFVQAGAN